MKAVLALLLMASLSLQAQEIVNLYPGTIPNSKESDKKESYTSGMFRDVVSPTLEVYLPEKEKATGTAVIVCPGGGYSVVVYQGEGISTAQKFAEKGIAAFVLKYRLPDDLLQPDKSIAPLQDAQQAIKVVRENAGNWNIDPHRIGIVGFSAGGHLASTAATHFDKSYIPNSLGTNLRPDFQILVYPVISMQDSLTHKDSRRKLLGENPSKEMIDEFSGELQVTENTPPAYITHTADDRVVDVDNSIGYFEQLRHHNVPVEMHIYPKGGHGFIFGRKNWMDPLLQWMSDNNFANNQ